MPIELTWIFPCCGFAGDNYLDPPMAFLVTPEARDGGFETGTRRPVAE
jgi:hypothetical protein